MRRHLVYLDNNVVSRLTDGSATGLQAALSGPLQAVYSDVTMEDMDESTSIQTRIAFLDRIEALHICEEPEPPWFSLSQKLASQRKEDLRADPNLVYSAKGLQRSFVSLYRDLLSPHETRNLGEIVRSGLVEQGSILRDLLRNDEHLGVAAPHVSALIDAVFDKIALDIPINSLTDSPVSGHRKLLESGLGPELTGLRPPNLILQIIERLGGETQTPFEGASAIINENKFLELAINLNSLGFAQNKKSRSRNTSHSLKGASTDVLDSMHISLALRLPAFITCDRGSARKHFAIAEYTKMPSFTIYMDGEGGLHILSSTYWPL